MVKIIIIGCNGHLGKFLFINLGKKKNFNVYGMTSKKIFHKNQIKINYKNLNKVKSIINNFNTVIYCASETKFEKCEKKTKKSIFLNIDLIKSILEDLKQNQKIIYLSSFGILGKFKKKPIYIKQKEYIEKKIMSKVLNYTILRPAKIFETINLKKYKKFFIDQKIALTNLIIINNVISKVINTDFKGVINLASSDKISYFDLANLSGIGNIKGSYSKKENKFFFKEKKNFLKSNKFKFAYKKIREIIKC